MALLKRLWTYTLRLGFAALIAVAVLTSVLRFVQPLANDLRDELAALLSQRLGYEVCIGELRLGSAGLAPRLTLERVRLSRPEDGEVALSLRAIELDLDLASSLWTRAPQFDALTLIGARLTVERLADGRLRVLGLGGKDDPRALALFLGQGRLRLLDSEVIYLDSARGGKLARLADMRLRLQNAGNSHQIDLTARLASPEPVARAVQAPTTGAATEGAATPLAGNRLHLVAVLDGPPERPETWSGRVYVDLEVANLGLLIPFDRFAPVGLDTSRLSLALWQRISGGRVEQTLARIDLAGLRTRPRVGAKGALASPVALDHIHGLARLRSGADGWRADVSGLAASHGGLGLSGVDLDLRLADDWRLKRLGARAARLDLAALARLMGGALGLLPEALRDWVQRDPKGRARYLTVGVALPSAAGGRTRWSLSGDFAGLGLASRGKRPGFDGLSAQLTANQDSGRLSLGADQATLSLAPLFTLPIPLSQLSAELRWERAPDGAWRLDGEDIRLANADLSGEGRLALDVPADGSSPILDLKATFKDANAARTRTYLPAGIMGPKLVSWLERSIRSGRVIQGDATFKGALADYPFRNKRGRFELLLKFQDLLLDYQKGWPPIESAAGTVRLLNQGLSIKVERGRIYDSAFSAGRAELADTRDATSMRIHGEARGPFADGLRALTDTPLAATLGRLGRVLKVGGESHLALDIDLPLKHTQPLGVSGRLSWPAAAALSITGTPFDLSALQGDLRFTERSLAVQEIGAQLWGRPVTLSIASEGAGDPERSITRIQARAQTPVDELATRFPAAAWEHLGGVLDWMLAASLRNRDVNQESPPLDLALSSDLRGLEIALPAPLGKPGAAARELELAGPLIPGQSLSVKGRLGDLGTRLELGLQGGRARLLAGRISLGDPAPPDPESGWLVLDGRLAELDLEPWVAALAATTAAHGQGAGGATSASSDPESPTLGLDLQVGRLRLGGLALTDARLKGGRPSQSWEMGLSAKELAGRILVAPRADPRPLAIDLEFLDLKAVAGPPRKEPAARRAGAMDKVPSLDLRAKELRWGDARLGELELTLRREAGEIRLPKLQVSGPGLLSLKGDGGWTRGKDGGRSRANLSFVTQDLGRLLSALGDRDGLQAKEASATLRLAWPGELSDLVLRGSEGVIDLQVGAGRFLEVEPGVGRLLGFLNFSALGRRLALDFTDLYGQGFAFEKVAGRVTLAKGQAGFENFVIEGPAGKLTVGGSADLSTQRLDQTVTVEPKVGSSVALASAVAGGPVVGAAVYLVDRVAGNPLDRLASYRYRVTGPWGEPELQRLGWEPLATGEEPRASQPAKDRPKTEKNHFLDVP